MIVKQTYITRLFHNMMLIFNVLSHFSKRLFPHSLPFFWVYCMGLGCVVVFSTPAEAQKGIKKTTEENLTLETDTSQNPNLEYKLNTTDDKLNEQVFNQHKRKNKKEKKKVYFGIKTQGAFIKQENGTVEFFRVIEPSYLMKNIYQREVYYYDAKTRRIKVENYADVNTKILKKLPIYLLHGFYQKIYEGEVRESGYYYKGSKHDKWELFDKDGILLEKVKYALGILADSKISYYDEAETKIKEIIPILHGRMQGTYWAFHENGVLAMEGKYENNEKIGMWREWYNNRQRKRDTQYTTLWYEKKEPILLREWNEKGVMTFDIDRGGKQK